MKPPPLKNDCFAMPPGVDWTPVDVALEQLRDGLSPVVGTRGITVNWAGGRVLARPVVAKRPNPPFPNSAVDGFGFAKSTLPAGKVVELPLMPERAAAGTAFTEMVPAGHAIRILTGAALPQGVDTVVLEEDTTRYRDRIAFRSGLRQGANCRNAGEDFDAGDTLLRPGRLMDASDLALVAASGNADVEVFDRLRVGVLSTGAEIVAAGSPARADQIFDANRPMLLDMVRQWGFEPVDLGQVGDNRDDLRACLTGAATGVDAILTSGGASAGDEDHVSALLAEEGVLNTWRIAMKPGRPMALALWQGVPVFGLPGNPVAAFVCALVFAYPALRSLSGAYWPDRAGVTIPAAFRKEKRAGRREFLRARIDADGRAEVFPSEGSGRISGISWATGLVELPDAAVTIEPGDPVRFLPYSGFGLQP